MEKEKEGERSITDVLESFFIAREIMGITERASPFEINQAKRNYPSNGCKSKKELRAWVQLQNKERRKAKA